MIHEGHLKAFKIIKISKNLGLDVFFKSTLHVFDYWKYTYSI